ncbi:hypothetical protein Val02_24290 [Virgisporangium aliadipatigenens]|uniref:Uncharacterized protein n=1 Tax=Virgisporangium aliadipatigenens TaxID=741659 RepID=A0A8J3YK23_9ACTN|nr:DUF6624 domain-containing protein [Virgisporangium aliadipatigenens]GIJ45543.1 hypothetical protein Val02_24290 [Virgisporangium aliadipatigenens]
MSSPTHKALAEELIRRTDEDKAAQPNPFGDDAAKQLAHRRITTDNADRLAEIMDEHGWPTVALVGAEGARRAWLIAQHADRQLDVQRRAVRLMERAVADGQADAAQLAFLRDRMLTNEGRPQVYGTQIAGVEDGRPVPWPVEEPERMDQRRAEVGIPPFAAYTAAHAPG